MRPASRAFGSWLAASIAPVARAHGFTGNGPTFRKRDGSNWVLFVVERRRLDPAEARAVADDPQIAFQMSVGVVVSAVRLESQPGRDRPPGMHDITMYSPDRSLIPANRGDWHVFDANDAAGQALLTSLVTRRLGRVVTALGTSSAREVLDRWLSVTGPLENLSPGGANELLAMAMIGMSPAWTRDLRAFRERVARIG
jgi:hypothetical protein